MDLSARSVRGAIDAMERQYPGFGLQIFSADGALHRFVKIFCDGEAVDEEALDDAIDEKAEIEVVAAIAGGCAEIAGGSGEDEDKEE